MLERKESTRTLAVRDGECPARVPKLHALQSWQGFWVREEVIPCETRWSSQLCQGKELGTAVGLWAGRTGLRGRSHCLDRHEVTVREGGASGTEGGCRQETPSGSDVQSRPKTWQTICSPCPGCVVPRMCSDLGCLRRAEGDSAGECCLWAFVCSVQHTHSPAGTPALHMYINVSLHA